METEERHLICTKPFEWFEAAENWSGYPVHLCCSGWLPKPAGDLAKQSQEEIWHSEDAIKIRKSVLDGTFKYCKREFCPHLSNVSGPVKYVNDDELASYQAKIEKKDFFPKHLNCSYDKSCNLSCPSCRTELIMAKGDRKVEIEKIGTGLFEAFGSTLDTVYITGSGDPFASKHFLNILTGGGDLLRRFPQLNLHLHTNAQLFTSDIWNKIRRSKDKIDILEVSIDGASKDTYEVNRKPGKWETLIENMNFISSLKKAGSIRELKISFVVQKNNYKEIIDFIKLGKAWGVDTIYFSTLNNWFTQSNASYLRRAIHKESHPEHRFLLKELKRIDLQDKQVELGYFKNLLQAKSKNIFIDRIRNVYTRIAFITNQLVKGAWKTK